MSASSPDPQWSATLAAAYERESSYLWGLGYRLTGSAAQAEDLVQETFVRALRRPPADQAAPLRPWLRRVATNLGIDALRQRQRRRYDGPWLPEPIDTATLVDPDADVEDASLRREGLTLAFMALLEVLSPQQRAVVVLRDILGLSVAETADALEVGESNVKVAHHRARLKLAGPCEPTTPTLGEVRRSRELLEVLFAAIAVGDERRVLGLLDAEVRVTTDAGGVVRAARRVITGPLDVTRLLVGVARKGPPVLGVRHREINCLPALDVDFAPVDARTAGRIIVQGQVINHHWQLAGILMFLAPAKVAAVDRPPWLRPLTPPSGLRDRG
jgi:RNA polymerase sigma-70 factor (ECF subfamily)